MAEGFAKHLASDIFQVFSAGTKVAKEVKPKAIVVMKEKGIDISEQYPKLLEEIPTKLDILITMGCNVQCPFIPCNHREDWGIDDPVGKSIEVFRETRDIIEKKMLDLINRVKNKEL